MKKAFKDSLTTLLVIALTSIAVNAQAQSIHKKFPGVQGGTLEIIMEAGGSASITGWEQDIISVTYDDSRIGLDYWLMDFDAKDGNLKINARMMRPETDTGGLQFEIKVPRQFDIQFSSGGGQLKIDGIEGSFNGSLAGGMIFLTDLAGDVQLNTGGGNIKVTDSRLTGSVNTGAGDIILRLASGMVNASTGNGEIYVTIDSAELLSQNAMNLSSGLGDVTLAVPGNLSVALDVRLQYTKKASRSYKISSELDLDIEETPQWDYGHSEENPIKVITGTSEVAGGETTVTISTTNGNVRIEQK
jgi:DUF4097 and DUF4098 domain-containing protein YvlB